MSNTSYLFIANLVDITSGSGDENVRNQVVAYEKDEDFKRESQAAIQEALAGATESAKQINPNIVPLVVDDKNTGIVILSVTEPEGEKPTLYDFGIDIGFRITNYFDERGQNRKPVEVISCPNDQLAKETLGELSDAFESIRRGAKTVVLSSDQAFFVESIDARMFEEPLSNALN